jgi:hypothetical protein
MSKLTRKNTPIEIINQCNFNLLSGTSSGQKKACRVLRLKRKGNIMQEARASFVTFVIVLFVSIPNFASACIGRLGGGGGKKTTERSLGLFQVSPSTNGSDKNKVKFCEGN